MIPVELQVIGAALRAVAEEMAAALVRAAFSPNIKERRDSSTALFDARGGMVTQAESIPVHLGAMPEAVAAVMGHAPGPRRRLHPERPLRRRDAPSRRDARLANRARLCGHPRPSRRRRRRRAGEPAGRLAPARGGGCDHPADAARPGGARAPGRADAQSRRTAGRPARAACGAPAGGESRDRALRTLRP